MPVDRTIFPYRSAEDHLASATPEAISDWCLENRSAILASQNQAQIRGIDGNQDIQRYTVQGGVTLTSTTPSEGARNEASSTPTTFLASNGCPGRTGRA
jgi:hypothetical protein